MSLLRTILICIAISEVLWIAWAFLPSILHVVTGRASGIGIVVPRLLRWLPSGVQIPATLLGVPLVVGSLAGCVWYLLSRR
jgi:hypothetical protein